jgi:AcrR family transcriptional regulator
MTTYDLAPVSGQEIDSLRPGARRQQIVTAAAALFRERGYHGASMRDIGERVGMLKGSLYVHVSNKEEILLEIVSGAFRSFTDALQPVFDLEAGAADKITLGLAAHFQTVAGDPDSAYVFFHEGRHLAGQPRIWVNDAYNRYRSAWNRTFQAGIESGELRRDLDVDTATLLVLAAGDWCERHPARSNVSVEALASRFSRMLLCGCLADPSGYGVPQPVDIS